MAWKIGSNPIRSTKFLKQLDAFLHQGLLLWSPTESKMDAGPERPDILLAHPPIGAKTQAEDLESPIFC